MKSLQLEKLFIFGSLTFLSLTCFNQVNAAVTITSNGKQYQAAVADESVGYSAESSINLQQDGNSLYRGQHMKELDGDSVGVLSGSLFVKTKKQDEALNVPNAEVIEIGGGYYLVKAQQGVELLTLIEQLKAQDNVEHVELEVSVKDRVPY